MAEMDMGQEKQELSAWDKVAQLAQSGNPQALAEIAQIAEQELQAQQAEMQGGAQEGGSFEEKLMAAKKAQGGEQNG